MKNCWSNSDSIIVQLIPCNVEIVIVISIDNSGIVAPAGHWADVGPKTARASFLPPLPERHLSAGHGRDMCPAGDLYSLSVRWLGRWLLVLPKW